MQVSKKDAKPFPTETRKKVVAILVLISTCCGGRRMALGMGGYLDRLVIYSKYAVTLNESINT